jgi:hypothetical protein
MKRTFFFTGWISLLGLTASSGADSAVLWGRNVQPLFDVQCVKCHGPIERKSGLELDSPEGILKGGDEGAVVVPGEPEKSRLYLYLAADADPHMPPKKQLTEAERSVVRDWILALRETAESQETAGSVGRSFGSVIEAMDRLMAESWQRSGVVPAAEVEDPVWCRRVTLDLAGRIPTSAELDTFLRLPQSERRGAWVERLLASDEYAIRMRELLDVFLMGRVKREAHEDRRRQNGWWTYLEQAFRSNQPWDRTVRDLLTARPNNPAHQGAAWFLYERRNDHQAIAEAVAPVVYGTKLDCAQCHDHPLAREIKQGHYWGLVAAFNRGKNVEGRPEVAESAIGGFINFTNLKKESQPAVITLLNGRAIEESRPAGDAKEEDADDRYRDATAKVRVPKFSRREAFAEAATRDNPMLARAFVNRMWAAFLGRGLVHPLDEMTTRNLPSHPELLEWLADDFEAHQYDVRRLVRGIVLSRVYALGVARDRSPAPETFAQALERPLSAEQIARSWRVAAGWPPNEDGLRRAVTAVLPDVLPRDYNATFQQAQFLTQSAGLAELLRPVSGNTADRLAAIRDIRWQVDEAFRAVLGRLPDAEEAARVETFLRERRDTPTDAIRDLLWALMTNSEFLTTP